MKVKEETDTLQTRAADFESVVERALINADGLVMSALNIDTMRPFELGYFEGKHVHRFTGETFDDFAEYISYENVGMCSGAYLAALTWKYRATQDSIALDRARRTFNGIRHLFDMSQQLGEGFYCKCYGGRLSDQVSSDQYIYTLAGLDTFLEFASNAERASIVEMMGKMTDWWIKQNYTYPYFGSPLRWQLARYPVFAWLAWHHTGDVKFLHEFNRLCALNEVRNELPFAVMDSEEILEEASGRQPAFSFEVASNKRVIRVIPECTQSGFLSTEPLLDHNAPDCDLWLDKTRRLYELGRRFIADDGYALGPHLYDIQTGELTEIRELMADGSNYPGWNFLGLVAWIRSGMWSSMFARAATSIHRFFPDLGALETSRVILSKLDLQKLRWFVDMDGHQFPEDMKWMDRVLSGDAVTHWLWAYWEARARYGDPPGYETGSYGIRQGGEKLNV